MSTAEDWTVSTMGEAQAMGLQHSELGVLSSVRVRKKTSGRCVSGRESEASHYKVVVLPREVVESKEVGLS